MLPFTARGFSDSFAGLIEHARTLRDIEFREFTDVIEQSHKMLYPLGEPLRTSIGLNRWLVRAREESYSDWLGWLFEQMTAGELIDVLQIGELDQISKLDSGNRQCDSVRVGREVVVPDGHEGHTGRIDLTLELGKWAVVAIEVKKGNADVSDNQKEIGYRKSIENDALYKCREKEFILLCSKSSCKITTGRFHVRRYSSFCRNIRRLAVKHANSDNGRLFAVATILMIAASIESNLLSLSIDKGHYIDATFQHLKAFVNGAEYE